VTLYRVTYYYLATGMEGHADVSDYGYVEAESEDAACRVVARQVDGGRNEEWMMSCLSAKEV
jgi:hypothetical protein